MNDFQAARRVTYRCVYRMAFATKNRKPLIKDSIGSYMEELTKRLAVGYGGELISFSIEEDNIHFLISLPPQCDLSAIVRSIKTQLSKEVRKVPEMNEYIKKYISDMPLWSPSYFVETIGIASDNAMREYIRSEPRNGHKRQYVKKSKYWNQFGV